MIIKILLFFSLLNSLVFSQEKIFNSEFRLIGSIYTRHSSDNDVYNNKTDLIALEYQPIKNLGIYFGHFKNSFYNDSYVIGVGKYLRPFENFNNFYFSLGLGLVKGYDKVSLIYDSNTKDIIKKSKFDTHIGGDFIVGGNVGIGYDLTDYISINMSYVGAFISTINIKLF